MPVVLVEGLQAHVWCQGTTTVGCEVPILPVIMQPLPDAFCCHSAVLCSYLQDLLVEVAAGTAGAKARAEALAAQIRSSVTQVLVEVSSVKPIMQGTWVGWRMAALKLAVQD